jgi:chromosome segregation ATPase
MGVIKGDGPADPHAACRERLARAEEAAAAHEARLGEWDDDRARLAARLAEVERERQEIAQASADATRRYIRAERERDTYALNLEHAQADNAANCEQAEIYRRERDALRERVAGLEAALWWYGSHDRHCAVYGKSDARGVYIPHSSGLCDCGYNAALATPGPTP